MRRTWLKVKGVVTLTMRRLSPPTSAGAVRRVLTTPDAAARHYGWQAVAHPNMPTLRRGHVVAQPAAVIGADGALLWGYAPQLTRTPWSAAAIWRHASQPKVLPGKVLFAAVDGFSYYHWLLGTLPKLLTARETHQLSDFARIIVNPRHKGVTNFQTESLALLGVEPEQLLWLERGTHVVSDELLLPSEPANGSQTVIKPWAVQLLRQALLELAARHDAPAGPERLFVSRARARRRRLVDEAAVMAVLSGHGFEAVVLEDLPLLTQIKWFSEARQIVGLHGAGLANLVFCRPGTNVVEFLPEAWPNRCFEHLSAAVGAFYARIPAAGVGPRRGFAQDQVLGDGALPALQRLV